MTLRKYTVKINTANLSELPAIAIQIQNALEASELTYTQRDSLAGLVMFRLMDIHDQFNTKPEPEPYPIQ